MLLGSGDHAKEMREFSEVILPSIDAIRMSSHAFRGGVNRCEPSVNHAMLLKIRTQTKQSFTSSRHHWTYGITITDGLSHGAMADLLAVV